ncbi:MAG TPA: pyridoxal-phosphate dependent enzyme [Acidimicrobiia bacterium]|nr:pyridoxal-phosphate dependent enzyme [Acidimicrobiia bacterium]
MSAHPGLAAVVEARSRIRGLAGVTPLIESPALAAVLGAPVWLKAECLQETGSFKVRGAANALLSLPKDRRAAGVVAVSSGNHGRAVAHVARALGVAATICLSSRVPRFKVEAIEALGVRVVVAGPDQDDAEGAARRLEAEDGLAFIHPFDDPAVIAGQGTIALEVLDEQPDIAAFIVPLSGGGLLSGIAAGAKGMNPAVRMVGVSQDRGPAMYESLRAGAIVPVVEEDTLADALAGGLGAVNHHTLAMCRALVDETLLVSEGEIADAMRWLHTHHDLRVEGGGAVGVAAILAGKVASDGPTVVVVSGGNIGDGAFDAVIRHHRG